MDLVNHPPHYGQHPTGIECITIAEAFNFNLGNALKYIWRAGLKGNQIEDLKKAAWYINREIGRIEDEVRTNSTSELAAAIMRHKRLPYDPGGGDPQPGVS